MSLEHTGFDKRRLSDVAKRIESAPNPQSGTDTTPFVITTTRTVAVRTNADRVRQFHEAFGIPVGNDPHIPYLRVPLRLDLIDEETRELEAAIEANDLQEFADALGDLLYVTYGFALEAGLPIDKIFERIHTSNMSKLGTDGKPVYRADGKVLKGPHFTEPELGDLLAPAPEVFVEQESCCEPGSCGCTDIGGEG